MIVDDRKDLHSDVLSKTDPSVGATGKSDIRNKPSALSAEDRASRRDPVTTPVQIGIADDK